MVASMINILGLCAHAQRHIELGEAIAPLREQGVLVIGSGSSWHNMRRIKQSGPGAMDNDSKVRPPPHCATLLAVKARPSNTSLAWLSDLQVARVKIKGA